ncbi:MAG TPA: SH3 domain-containing protein [Alphaproteobacteria bacterium]|nr:SH3 domain-containing protein [Alphaproteobacteria bacterium]
MREISNVGRLYLILIAVFCLALYFPFLVAAQAAEPDEQQTESRALPRFVTIKAKEINIRTGPGERYPIDWVMQAKGWPLQVVAEYENWRRVKDWEGNMGWVHRAMLSNARAGVVQVETTTLRRAPSAEGTPLAHVKQGTHAEIKKCDAGWCQVEFDEASGWIPAKTIWGGEN